MSMANVMVQISEETKRQLDMLREVEQIPDLDSTIRHLIGIHSPIRKVKPITWDDLPPKYPKRVAWTKADKLEFSKMDRS